jgi:predicted nuclease of predicted toxin-antitoxin system
MSGVYNTLSYNILVVYALDHEFRESKQIQTPFSIQTCKIWNITTSSEKQQFSIHTEHLTGLFNEHKYYIH